MSDKPEDEEHTVNDKKQLDSRIKEIRNEHMIDEARNAILLEQISDALFNSGLPQVITSLNAGIIAHFMEIKQMKTKHLIEIVTDIEMRLNAIEPDKDPQVMRRAYLQIINDAEAHWLSQTSKTRDITNNVGYARIAVDHAWEPGAIERAKKFVSDKTRLGVRIATLGLFGKKK